MGRLASTLATFVSLCITAGTAVEPVQVAQPRIKLSHTLVHVEQGGSVNISCSATGDHPISVEWRRDGQTLEESGSGKALLDDNVQEQLVSNLVINEVDTEHAGRYVCVAKNAFGEDQGETQLLVREAPQMPESIEVSGIWSRGARLTWSAPKLAVVTGYGVWFWSHRDLTKLNVSVPGSSTTVQIPKLHPATEYKLYIIAYTDAGPSERSRTVTVRTEDEQPSEAPSNVHVISTGPSHAVISWLPTPESEWNSERLTGYFVGYKAACSNVSDSPYAFHTVAPNQTTCTLRGLSKYTLYGVVVKAVNSVGYSPPSAKVSFHTDDGDYIPPPLMYVSALNDESANLRWSSSSPNVTGFTIYSRQDEQGVWERTPIDNPDQTAYQLTGLDLNKQYQVYIVAHTSLGETEPSDVLLISRKSPAQINAEARILYTVVPLASFLLVTAAMLYGAGVYMYVKHTRAEPPPPFEADYNVERDEPVQFTPDK